MIEWLSRLVHPKTPETGDRVTGDRRTVGIVPLLIIGAIGVALILIGSGRFARESTDEPEPQVRSISTRPGNEETPQDYASALERNLEAALGQMRGIGSVSVIVTLEADARSIYATITSNDEEQIEEKDSSGGVRTTTRAKVTEEPVITRTSGGGEQLVIVGSEPPRVKGVLVVADGARTPEVKLEIAQAVSSVLGIALYRVAVVEREV